MSAHAAKMLISFSSQKKYLLLSSYFCPLSGIYLGCIQGVCHTACLGRHIIYLQTSNITPVVFVCKLSTSNALERCLTVPSPTQQLTAQAWYISTGPAKQ